MLQPTTPPPITTALAVLGRSMASSFVHDHPTKVQFVVDPCGPNNQTGRTRRHERGAEKGRCAARAGGPAGQRPCFRRQLGRLRHSDRPRAGQSFPPEARLMRFRALVTLTAAATVVFAVAPAFAQVKGTASYRERIALPPAAVFEATLEDLSKGD